MSDAVVVVSTPDELKKLLGPSPGSSDSAADEASEESEAVIREHTLTSIEGEIRFTTEAGKLPVQVDEAKGRIFYTLYRRTDLPDDAVAERPVVFCFNGGPGSASIWLHLGGVGPWRVPADVDNLPHLPRAHPNPETLLTRADLVFIDPIATGFSTPDGSGDEARKPFTGVQGDVASVADFIRRLATRHQLWSRPIFLMGESYGTTRAAGLAKHLLEAHGLAVDGLILVSIALQLGTLLFTDVHDAAYLLVVPTYAATAAYHGKLSDEVVGDDLRAFLREVEDFTYDELAPALIRGDRLPADERQAIAARLARYVGVSTDFVLRCNLRISLARFCRELLRDERKTVGRLDSRFTGYGADAQEENLTMDPSMHGVDGVYTRAFHDLLARHLGVDDEAPYTVLSYEVNRSWTWDDATNQALDVAGRLRDAMNMIPGLRVMVASGLFDLATPYAAAEYTLARMGLEPDVRERLVVHEYEAGHMMYLHEASRLKLDADVKAFLEG